MAKQFSLTNDAGSEWLSCKNYKSAIKAEETSVVVFFEEGCGTCRTDSAPRWIASVTSLGLLGRL